MPKVETFLTEEQIKHIEKVLNKQSRSSWIKDAVQEKLDKEKEGAK